MSRLAMAIRKVYRHYAAATARAAGARSPNAARGGARSSTTRAVRRRAWRAAWKGGAFR